MDDHVLLTFFFISEMGEHMIQHGDGVKDIAFEVEDLAAIFEVSIKFCCPIKDFHFLHVTRYLLAL